MMTKFLCGLLVGFTFAVVGCASDTDDEEGVQEGATEEEADVGHSEDAIKQPGGCSKDQIKHGQDTCRKQYGAKSKGIQYCNRYAGGGWGYMCSVRK